MGPLRQAAVCPCPLPLLSPSCLSLTPFFLHSPASTPAPFPGEAPHPPRPPSHHAGCALPLSQQGCGQALVGSVMENSPPKLDSGQSKLRAPKGKECLRHRCVFIS